MVPRTTTSAPAPATIVSRPAPPVNVSEAPPEVIISAPDPPVMVAVAALPVNTNFPVAVEASIFRADGPTVAVIAPLPDNVNPLTAVVERALPSTVMALLLTITTPVSSPVPAITFVIPAANALAPNPTEVPMTPKELAPVICKVSMPLILANPLSIKSMAAEFNIKMSLSLPFSSVPPSIVTAAKTA